MAHAPAPMPDLLHRRPPPTAQSTSTRPVRTQPAPPAWTSRKATPCPARAAALAGKGSRQRRIPKAPCARPTHDAGSRAASCPSALDHSSKASTRQCAAKGRPIQAPCVSGAPLGLPPLAVLALHRSARSRPSTLGSLWPGLRKGRSLAPPASNTAYLRCVAPTSPIHRALESLGCGRSSYVIPWRELPRHPADPGVTPCPGLPPAASPSR
jgi:hypothetical protein